MTTEMLSGWNEYLTGSRLCIEVTLLDLVYSRPNSTSEILQDSHTFDRHILVVETFVCGDTIGFSILKSLLCR
jgi:hypothetical protein